MLQSLKNTNLILRNHFSYTIFKLICILWSFTLFNSHLSAEIIYLGADLQKTFPFAADVSKRGTDAPYLSGNTFRSIANWWLDETNIPIDTDKVKNGDIIYVKGCLLDSFFGMIHPHIKEPYILLSCDADDTNGQKHHMPFVNSDTLVVMGCVNCQESRHPKIIQLPLGIPNGSAVGFPKKQEFTDLINKKVNKTIFCSSNFAICSHDWREHVHNIVQNKPFISMLPKTSPSTYIYNMAASLFCISPRGAGMDCFRNWEALILGCVPIVESSFLDPLFYRLPVLIVDDYEHLTQQQLYEYCYYVVNNPDEFDLEKTYAKYWTDFFLTLQELLRSNIEHESYIKDFKEKSFNL